MYPYGTLRLRLAKIDGDGDGLGEGVGVGLTAVRRRRTADATVVVLVVTLRLRRVAAVVVVAPVRLRLVSVVVVVAGVRLRRVSVVVVMGALRRRGCITFVCPLMAVLRRRVDATIGGAGGGALRRTSGGRSVVGVYLRRLVGADGLEGARRLRRVSGAGGERRRRRSVVAEYPPRLRAESKRCCADSSSVSPSMSCTSEQVAGAYRECIELHVNLLQDPPRLGE